MLSSIEIRNFQSLHDIKLDLSRFTVIVGPSSSGKSAFTRAVRTLTGNQRGDSFITHGERTCSIVAVTDKGTVGLSRGATNEYVLLPNDSPQQTYTKLGGTTPEEVTAFIGIAPKDPLNYANQFDMPYLLTASAAEVARTLGELTNVHTIFEASREANRRRAAHTATLKTRQLDLESLMPKIETYRPLKQQRAALEFAEMHLQRAADIETRISRLSALLALEHTVLSMLTNAEALASIPIPDLTQINAIQRKHRNLSTLVEAIQTSSDKLQLSEKILSHPVPTVEPIIRARQRLSSYQGIIDTMKANAGFLRSATATHTEQETALTTLQQQYTEILISAGTCPTCKQSTKELTHATH